MKDTEVGMIPRGIGLLGGTFDPVHAGHLAIAQSAQAAFGLVRVDFLPAGNPWQKDLVSPAEHRLAMLRLALDKMPDFRIEPMELERLGPTYSIETLRRLRRRLGPAMPLVLILGGDQWNNLHTWREWQSLTDYAHLAVCCRGGEALHAQDAVQVWAAPRMRSARTLVESSAGGIAFFDMPAHLASATAIRCALQKAPFARAMRELEGWVHPAVANYILENGLYGAR